MMVSTFKGCFESVKFLPIPNNYSLFFSLTVGEVFPFLICVFKFLAKKVVSLEWIN